MSALTDDQLKAAYNAPNGGHLGGIRAVANASASFECEECAKLCDDALRTIFAYHPDGQKQVGENVCINLASRIRSRSQGAAKPIIVDPKFIYLLTDAIKRLDALAESSSDEKVQYEVSYVSSQIDSFLTFTGLVEGGK